LAVPSLTLITMFEKLPVDVGVPVSRPVVALNVAHAGRFVIANVSVLPSGSLAVGVNEYAVPTMAEVGGVPEIVGARFDVVVVLLAVPPTVLTAVMSAAAPAVICVSAGAKAADAPVGSTCATAAGSMPGVSALRLCWSVVRADEGVVAIAAAVPLRAESIMPAVIGNAAVGAVIARVASRLIAPSRAVVAS
jgi:hypothetical protein